MKTAAKKQRTIDEIVTKVNCQYGAPMGRSNSMPNYPYSIVDTGKLFIVNINTKESKRIYECSIPMSGGYDRGGAYWGLPDNIRVRYTKDLSYVEFYRPGK